MNVTFFGNRVSADDQVKMRFSVTDVLIKREIWVLDKQAHREISSEDEGRDQGASRSYKSWDNKGN